MKQITPGEALNKAAAYCTLCERCISEVSTKLAAWGVPHGEQHEIIERLQQEGFIDEARYCRAFVNDKVRFNRWGRIKIRAALSEKRLPRELVNEAIDNINEEEYMSALAEVIAAKRRELKGQDDYVAQQKIMRYAAGRGYEPSLIMKAINYCGDEMDF
ncbi:MAG: RecX family transcriptional regulator [Bacteroidaceae bacterium]|nr:RecX family transcriptional regulator [Bacteroidaceae bacterium]